MNCACVSALEMDVNQEITALDQSGNGGDKEEEGVILQLVVPQSLSDSYFDLMQSGQYADSTTFLQHLLKQEQLSQTWVRYEQILFMHSVFIHLSAVCLSVVHRTLVHASSVAVLNIGSLYYMLIHI